MRKPASRDGGLILLVSPLLSSQLTSIVSPFHRRALQAEGEHGIARYRLADLALDDGPALCFTVTF
jgi:hypothetical protein